MGAYDTKRLAFLDVETTGLNPDYHEVISFAVAHVDPQSLEITGEQHWLAHPSYLARCDAGAVRVNGYHVDTWPANCSRGTLAEMCQAALSNSRVVGHNVSFDIRFTDALMRATNRKPANQHYAPIDTKSMAHAFIARGMLKASDSLSALCDHFGISNEGAHGALVDVRRTVALYRTLVGMTAGKAAA